jgi:hypothetical protein
MADLNNRLETLLIENAELGQAGAQLREAVDSTKQAVQDRFDAVALPLEPWMRDVCDQELLDKLRLHQVADLRKVSKGKLKKLGASREQMAALRDWVTTPRARRVKRDDPSKSDEACWYEAQALLWG